MKRASTLSPLVAQSIAELQRLAENFARRRDQLAASVKLTVGQWQILESVSDSHFMPSMFARERSSSLPAVSRTLRQLQDRGLVAAAIDPSDGRQRRYVLTAKGRDTMERLRDQRQEAIAQIWSKFDRAELEAFCKFSGTLSDLLEDFSRRKSVGKSVASAKVAGKVSRAPRVRAPRSEST